MTKGTFVAEPSHPAIAKEWRAFVDAIARCPRGETTFDESRYAPDAIATARDVWTVRMIAEHRSTSVFAAMATQLMEANAPVDATAVVLRMAADELRHGELCAEVVRALGGNTRADLPLDVAPLARHAGCTAEERAMRNVIYGCCLSEVVNSARFVSFLETTTDPFVRDATRLLLADERLHGQFGFLYLETQRPFLDAHPEVLISIDRYLRHAFAVLERELSGVGSKPREMTADLHALGVPDPARLPETFYATVEHAIVPGLERFGFDAMRAWKERSLVRPA
jgi:hypothetical protein